VFRCTDARTLPGVDDDERGDRHCPSCGTLMMPVGMPSGEIVSRCPRCGQVAI
jgi:ribosomal protein S27AE